MRLAQFLVFSLTLALLCGLSAWSARPVHAGGDDDQTFGSFSNETLGEVSIAVDAKGRMKVTWKHPNGKSETRSFTSCDEFKAKWADLAKRFVKLEVGPGHLVAEVTDDGQPAVTGEGQSSTGATGRSSSSSSSSSSNTTEKSDGKAGAEGKAVPRVVAIEVDHVPYYVVFDGERIVVKTSETSKEHPATEYASCEEFAKHAPELCAAVLRQLMLKSGANTNGK